MTPELKAMFDKHEDECLRFDRVPNKLHSRPDLCAFLLLDKLVPSPGMDMIGSSAHDQFYLSVTPEDLAAVATENDLLTLIRCGVMYDSGTDSLYMFS